MLPPKSELTSNIKDEPGEDGIGLVSPDAYPEGWDAEDDEDDEEDEGSDESLPTSSNKGSSSKSKPTAKENSGKPYKCDRPDCKKAFADKPKLKKHLQRHDRLWRCKAKGCTKDFGSNQEMERHMWTSHESTAKHLGLTPQTTECRKCGRSLRRRDYLRKHESKCDGRRKE